MTAVLLLLAPTLVLLTVLLLGCYPGERLIERARRPAPHASTRAPASTPLPPRRPRARLPRGGQLVSRALAGRAPPLRPS